MSDAAPANLTGSWSGIFNYPHDMQPNGFNAILKDDGGVLVGETSEHSDDFDDSASVLHAWLEGRYDGDSVTFVKSYDAANRVDYSVSYRGSVSGDGTEIRGI